MNFFSLTLHRYIILHSFPFLISTGLFAQISVSTALCDNKKNPVGIQTSGFLLSWKLASSGFNQTQTAYQYAIASSEELLKNNQFDIYNSQKTISSKNLLNAYKGNSLQEATKYYWKVRVWDQSNKPSEWSAIQFFITGIFTAELWRNAAWIGHDYGKSETRLVPFVHGTLKPGDKRITYNLAAPYLRKSFVMDTSVKSALFFISGLGHYDAFLNGKKLGNAFLSPGWTNYDKTILYNIFDVTNQIQSGANAIGVQLGNGFYHISQERYVKGTGSFGFPKMIALLKLEYHDNTVKYVVSDHTWKTDPSPTIFNNIYGGEDFDARLMQPKWNAPDFNDIKWKDAILTDRPTGTLQPEIDHSVVFADTLVRKNLIVIDPYKFVADFGQNVSGIPMLRIKGTPGQKIKITPGELICKDGSLNQAGGVSPHYYEYTIGSNQEESWQPQFTYFAVRYIQIEGATMEKNQKEDSDLPVVVDLKILHSRNSAPKNGYFFCSDTLINKIYSLIDWAVKSNLQSYITDNPQREKLSWQGEQNFMRTAINYGYEMYNMYHSLIKNIQDAQHPDGLIPDIAPEYMQFEGPFVDSPEWGTTGILNLWFLYKFYGDTSLIRKAYPMMTSYAAYLQKKSEKNLLLYGLGDWLDIGDKTPVGLTATAYYYEAIMKLSNLASLIGENTDAQYYGLLAKGIKNSFNKKFYDAERGIYATGHQTAMAMPLVLGLVEQKNYNRVLKNLVHHIKYVDSYKLTAGDVGHKYLVRALFENNFYDVLDSITHRQEVPGYAYQLNLGATSLAETWDGKYSQNQLAMGHIWEWFFEGIAGIRQKETAVAFKRILIKPQMLPRLSWAAGGFQSPYGWIQTKWEKSIDCLTVNIELPVNTRATVVLPYKTHQKIKVNGKQRKSINHTDREFQLNVGAGKYIIEVLN